MTNPKLQLNSLTQKIGKKYEELACQFLQKKGLILIAQNWLQPKVGELDLVMIQKGKTWDTLVFVEVKGRSAFKNGQFGTAVDSITPAKQKKVIDTAQHFLQANPEYENYECRFDVVCFDGVDGLNKTPEWIQGAFLG